MTARRFYSLFCFWAALAGSSLTTTPAWTAILAFLDPPSSSLFGAALGFAVAFLLAACTFLERCSSSSSSSPSSSSSSSSSPSSSSFSSPDSSPLSSSSSRPSSSMPSSSLSSSLALLLPCSMSSLSGGT
uniref:Putative cell wall integrity and stress response component 1 n=1 Tax=Ixodes ricinus TaxID=34613 RepID=A0A147BF61_IXORI